MDKYESLGKYIDAIINNNQEEAKAAFQSYSVNKSRELLGTVAPKDTLKEFKDALREFVNDDNGAESPIKLNGDDIVVNGKVVGSVQSDLNDMDGGINFVAAEGNFSKEFNSAEELYAFLMKRYGVKE